MTSTSQPALLKGRGLPDYAAITPEAVGEHLPGLLRRLEEQLVSLETSLQQKLGQGEAISWTDVMPPLQRIGEQMRWSWGVVTHLNGVCNSPELNEEYQKKENEKSEQGSRI